MACSSSLVKPNYIDSKHHGHHGNSLRYHARPELNFFSSWRAASQTQFNVLRKHSTVINIMLSKYLQRLCVGLACRAVASSSIRETNAQSFFLLRLLCFVLFCFKLFLFPISFSSSPSNFPLPPNRKHVLSHVTKNISLCIWVDSAGANNSRRRFASGTLGTKGWWNTKQN